MPFTFSRFRKSKKRLYPDNGVVLLARLSAPQINRILLACLCALLVNAAVLVKPVILKVVIDDFLIANIPQEGFHSIAAMGILYLLASLSGSMLSYAQANLVNAAGQKIVQTLRSRVFKTIQLLPLSYLDQTSSGRLITRATNDIAEISDMYTDVLINLVRDVILLAGILYAMISLSPELTLVSFLVIPLMVALVAVIKKRVRENFVTVKHIIGKINGFMAENLSGMKLIQIYRAEKEKQQEFEVLNREYFLSTMIQTKLNCFLRPASDIFQVLATAILVWYGMYRITGHTLQIGVLFAFTTYIKQFFNPISDLAEKYNSIQSALVSTERIYDLLNKKDILEELDEGIPVNKLQGSIEFRNVWFAYHNEDWILKDVSFKIEKGQSAAFVGETGAGKTTIISLINGFYPIQKGEILIDGMNIDQIRLKDLRRQIAVVLQDVFLFSGTIKENITLNDDIGEDRLNEALKASCVDQFAGNFRNGILEPVMERGVTLSAGQRQLISFARALVHDPSVFILDEATSNIDTHTEKLIQQAIEGVMKDRTAIFIAHRLSTIQNADQIIVMKGGRIAERGSHKDLLEREGYYKNLLDKSLGQDKAQSA